MAIALLGAAVLGVLAAGVFRVAQGGRPAGVRDMGALGAGGMTFIGVANLGFTIGSFLSG